MFGFPARGLACTARDCGRGGIRAFLPHLAILLALWATAARPAAATGDASSIPTPEERERILKIERDRHARRSQRGRKARLRDGRAGRSGTAVTGPEGAVPEGAAAGVDALHYTLDLIFDTADKTVSGDVTGEFEVLSSGLTTLALDLYDNMTVSSVTLGPASLPYTHAGNLLTITLDRPYSAGETFSVVVSYSGVPQSAGFGSFTWSTHQGQQVFWSLSEPTYGPTWWPSVDDPADKVTADMIFNVKSNLVAVSNGVLLSTDNRPGNRTAYHWQTTYPTAPYLISIACSNYDTFADLYTPQAGGDPMEIRYWVYPEDLADAQVSLAATPTMMDIFAGLFGEYPFLAEKYGMATVGFFGGMEHQTATSYGAGLITGDNTYDWINAHELAHSWWGDSLTLVEWPDTWTHEGFATYSEALYFEVLNGIAFYHTYMNSLDSGPFSGPLYDNPSQFGRTVYNKGGWVLHMLRHVMGDADFFDLLFDYHAQNTYGITSTPLFQAAAEAEYGQALSWFFDEWVYGEGRPAYQWGWSAVDLGLKWKIYIHIDQTQAGQSFRMPLDVEVQTVDLPTSLVIWNDATSQDFIVDVLAQPTDVTLDGDGWVLKTESQVTLPDGDADGVPDSADNCGAVHNPLQEDLDGDSLGDPCDPDIDGDGALNAADCAPLDSGSYAVPGEAGGLEIAGNNLSWPGLDAQAGPAVLYDLIRGGVADLFVDDGVSGAVCLAGSDPGPSIADGEDPVPGEARYYLIRGRNICGLGPYGWSSSGAPHLNTACP